MTEGLSGTMPSPPRWYPCRDSARCCNLDRESFLSRPFIMAKCQPPVIEAREPATDRKRHQDALQQRTQQSKISTRERRERARTQKLAQPMANDPFPFLDLPRELRDQVCSHLVVQPNSGRSIIAAGPILRGRKRRVAAEIKRYRVNQRRISDGKPAIHVRQVDLEPLIHLDLLQASRRLYDEAKDALYSSNWFAITLEKLPLTVFQTPFGWDLSRITKLQVEMQLKDAAHMNSYVDWAAFFPAFTSLRSLHIVPTFFPRYFEWANTELSDWATTHYIHKAFFRELLATLPCQIDVKFGRSADSVDDMHLQGKVINETLIKDMHAELGVRQLA
ncbi:hypothetical protein BDU57DRAFT_553051 [Ampelomyces quisqualis]|uniref:Uncharacterized protein n=1 Tax=Ampelomyces quisqualis TaxID=50730 RepID=A0A6A5R0T0_AMPQU|nr:hypothetical protein BDU57DRAFT_553051 [Ampelomyces quisqualis]